MKHEAWFFIGFFVFIFVVWIAIGGPTRSASLDVPSLSSSEVSGTTTASGWGSFSLPQAPLIIGDSAIVLPGSSSDTVLSSGTGAPPFDPVPGFTFAPASPLHGTVSLSRYVSNADASDARSEYVQVSVEGGAPSPVNITGWTLRSGASGRQATIPGGTATPTAGVVNPIRDIVLFPGESAIIVSGVSPIGTSFRENKCIGYFGSLQTFTPSLPQGCPSAADDLAAFYGASYIRDPSCIDYADSLPRCEVPATLRTTILSKACRAFLGTYMNYNGCVSLHSKDADFGGNAWRIYLGRDKDEPLWRTRHEVVELLDREGKTVDAFSY